MVLNSGALISGTPVLRYPYQGNVIFQNIRIRNLRRQLASRRIDAHSDRSIYLITMPAVIVNRPQTALSQLPDCILYTLPLRCRPTGKLYHRFVELPPVHLPHRFDSGAGTKPCCPSNVLQLALRLPLHRLRDL